MSVKNSFKKHITRICLVIGFAAVFSITACTSNGDSSDSISKGSYSSASSNSLSSATTSSMSSVSGTSTSAPDASQSDSVSDTSELPQSGTVEYSAVAPQSASQSQDISDSADASAGNSYSVVENDPVYEITAFVDGEYYTTAYADKTNGYDVSLIGYPEDITVNTDSKQYFYGWFSDPELTESFDAGKQIEGDTYLYGIMIPVDEGAFKIANVGRNVVITGLKDTNVQYVGVPSRIKNKRVDAVSSRAFSDSSVKVVYIAEGVKTLRNSAFSGCESLETVILPESVENVSYYAFSGCVNLKSLNLPSGVRSVDDYAFAGCTALNDIILGAGVGYIGDNAFEGCENLSAIYYGGDENDWARIHVGIEGNEFLLSAPVYYYSEVERGYQGYWYYDQYGNAVLW